MDAVNGGVVGWVAVGWVAYGVWWAVSKLDLKGLNDPGMRVWIPK